jgi:hypothetical protein
MSPIQDRDWYRGKHPPSCTCVDCNSSKLGKPTKKYQKTELPVCPLCGQRSLFFNNYTLNFDCLDKDCKASGRTIDEIRNSNSNKPNIKNKTSSQKYPNAETVIQSNRLPPVYTKGTTDGGGGRFRKYGRFTEEPIPDYLKAILLVFALSIIGIVLGIFIGGLYLFWMLLCFSLVYSIEKWFSSVTYKYKWIGKVYRFILNLLLISTLGFLIWSAVNLFSQRFTTSPLTGTLVFIAELAFFVWLWRVVSKNSWRWPSMKLTVLSLAILFVVSAFAGVKPLSTYKDDSLAFLKTTFSHSENQLNTMPNPTVSKTAAITSRTVTTPKTTPPLSSSTTTIPGNIVDIDRSNFPLIDQYAIDTPVSACSSIDVLATYLITPAKNDYEKTRAIYKWITQNIAYDYSAYLTKNYGSTSAASVLATRKSVCQGYSELFKALGKSAGLNVIIVSGWAKGISYSLGDAIDGPTNHAWNAVKINGGWYLIDSTWGAGSIKDGGFVRDYDDFYFLSPPEQFVVNHLPEEKIWQLLAKPLSRTEYAELPYTYSNFFSYGLGLGTNTKGIIDTQKSLTLSFPTPANVYLIARIYQSRLELDNTYATAVRVGNNYQISVNFPSTGEYLLRLFARQNDQYGGMYDCIVEYRVMVEY